MKLSIYIEGKLNKIFTIISNFISSLKASSFENKLIEVCNNYEFHAKTKYNLWNTLDIFNKVHKNKIQGSIVECGVWQGINLVLFQKLVEKHNLKNHKIYGFDTFEGIPPPTAEDITKYDELMKKEYERLKKSDGTSGWNYATINEVKKNYFQNTLPNDNLILIKGKVEDTLLDSNNIPEKISILILDTSLYEGTKIELEKLFSKVQKGGAVIVDGYAQYKGVKKAVDDYLDSKVYLIKFYRILGRAVIYL
jgi:hypothetical protein